MRIDSIFLSPARWTPQVAAHRDSDASTAPAPWRRPLAVAVGIGGVALYNWWIVAALHGHFLTTSDELFSDLEATGRPDASLLQHLDLAAGLVLITALALRGPKGPHGRRPEWSWLVAFAAAGAVGGRFAYACPEGLSASCRAAEWRLALPAHHYVHVAAGILEFATATVAAYLGWKRTSTDADLIARAFRWMGGSLVLAYPFLAFAYLTDRLGAFIEPVFFVCFSILAVVELVETDRPVSQAFESGWHSSIPSTLPDGDDPAGTGQSTQDTSCS